MISLILIWAVLFLVLLYAGIGLRKDGGALTLSYFSILSLIHVPGAIAYVFGAWALVHREETELGFQLTVIGMTAFVAGAMLARVGRKTSTIPNNTSAEQEVALRRMSREMMVVGFATFIFFIPLAKLVPSLTSVVQPLTALMVLGLWIRLYNGMVTRNPTLTYSTFAFIPVFPALTAVTGGFIGFGTYWSMSVVAFYVAAVRKRAWMLILAPFVMYLALSVFVTYMRDRDLLRDVVWYEKNSTLDDKFSRFWSTMTNFEFLDFNNENHLSSIDNRLNQNYFVGVAAERLQTGEIEPLYGATVPVWALIPRAVWPDKPPVGGGRTVVQDVTGLDLAEGTSFGAGQILEFYVNFGTWGIILGMFGFGFVLRRLDQAIIKSLNRLDVRTLAMSAMPGFVLLQPSGNLLEILVGVVASIITSVGLSSYLESRLRQRRSTDARLA